MKDVVTIAIELSARIDVEQMVDDRSARPTKDPPSSPEPGNPCDSELASKSAFFFAF